MKTSNVLHETRCCKCSETAIVTIPNPGDEPKGYCLPHLTEHETRLAVNRVTETLMDAVFKALGGTNTV